MGPKFLNRYGFDNAWVREAVLALVALALGFGAMPFLIFFAGSMSLGRYDGASPARIFDGVYEGLSRGSTASWIVVLGPYGLYLIFKALRLWWRAGARLAA